MGVHRSPGEPCSTEQAYIWIHLCWRPWWSQWPRESGEAPDFTGPCGMTRCWIKDCTCPYSYPYPPPPRPPPGCPSNSVTGTPCNRTIYLFKLCNYSWVRESDGNKGTRAYPRLCGVRPTSGELEVRDSRSRNGNVSHRCKAHQAKQHCIAVPGRVLVWVEPSVADDPPLSHYNRLVVDIKSCGQRNDSDTELSFVD